MFHTIQKGSLEYLTADALEGSVHCFTTRYGGVSTGQFSTLNLGTSRGDSMENVLRNYEILGAAVGFSPEDVVHTWQEHTDTILRVGKVDCGKGLFRNQPEVCDGLITDEPGVALVCFAADCTPVLLFDPVKNVAAAVHAGWRGTANGIVRKTVEKMAREFGSNPADIGAAIGPCRRASFAGGGPGAARENGVLTGGFCRRSRLPQSGSARKVFCRGGGFLEPLRQKRHRGPQRPRARAGLFPQSFSPGRT